MLPIKTASHNGTSSPLTYVTPLNKFLKCPTTVLRQASSLRLANQMSILSRFLPTFTISMLRCLKDFTSVPRLPLTVTTRLLTERVTGMCVSLRYAGVYYAIFKDTHTITRDVNYLSCLYGPHLCERWTKKFGYLSTNITKSDHPKSNYIESTSIQVYIAS